MMDKRVTKVPAELHIDDLVDIEVWRNGQRPALPRRAAGWFRCAGRLALAMVVVPIVACLPRRLRLSLYPFLRAAFGVAIDQKQTRAEVAGLTEGAIVASNHISVIDVFAAMGQPKAAMLIGDDADRFTRAAFICLARCSGTQIWFVADTKGLARRFLDWRKDPTSTALYVTPEQTIGNQKALFRFQPTFLDRGRPVVPLAMRLVSSAPLNIHPLHSRQFVILLRLLAQKSLRFEICFLPRQVKQQGQDRVEFSQQIQQAIADALVIPASDFEVADKRALRALTAGRK